MIILWQFYPFTAVGRLQQ